MPRPTRIELGYHKISDLIDGKLNHLFKNGKGEHKFVLAEDCNVCNVGSIPGNVNLNSETYRRMAAGTPLLSLAIARGSTKCLIELEEQAKEQAEDQQVKQTNEEDKKVKQPNAENTNLIDTLLAQKNININAIGYIGETPLHRCVDALNTNAAEKLINKGAKTNIKDSHGKTAYQKAMEKFTYLCKSKRAPKKNIKACHLIIKLTAGNNPIPDLQKALAARTPNNNQVVASTDSGSGHGPLITQEKNAANEEKQEKQNWRTSTTTAHCNRQKPQRNLREAKELIITKINNYKYARPHTTMFSCAHGLKRANTLKEKVINATDLESLDTLVSNFLATGYVEALKNDGKGCTLFRGASSKNNSTSLRRMIADALNVNLKHSASAHSIKSAISTEISTSMSHSR